MPYNLDPTEVAAAFSDPHLRSFDRERLASTYGPVGDLVVKWHAEDLDAFGRTMVTPSVAGRLAHVLTSDMADEVVQVLRRSVSNGYRISGEAWACESSTKLLSRVAELFAGFKG